MKTNCDHCKKPFRKNSHSLKAERAWYQCECGTTTIIDPDKEFAEWQCSECGNCWTSKYPIECVACGSHAIHQNFVRYVTITEIEEMI